MAWTASQIYQTQQDEMQIQWCQLSGWSIEHIYMCTAMSVEISPRDNCTNPTHVKEALEG